MSGQGESRWPACGAQRTPCRAGALLLPHGWQEQNLGHETWQQHLHLLSHVNSPSTGILRNRFLSPPSEFIVQGTINPDYQIPYPLHTRVYLLAFHFKQIHLNVGLVLWLLF